jgi:hypothetical protein
MTALKQGNTVRGSWIAVYMARRGAAHAGAQALRQAADHLANQVHYAQHATRTKPMLMPAAVRALAATGAAVGATLLPLAAVRSTRLPGARLVLTVVSSGCPFFVTVASSWRRPLKLRPLPCRNVAQVHLSAQLNSR